jgi:hypothetical protein
MGVLAWHMDKSPASVLVSTLFSSNKFQPPPSLIVPDSFNIVIS